MKKSKYLFSKLNIFTLVLFVDGGGGGGGGGGKKQHLFLMHSYALSNRRGRKKKREGKEKGERKVTPMFICNNKLSHEIHPTSNL